MSPSTPPDPAAAFFARSPMADVLVAELLAADAPPDAATAPPDAALAGYVLLGRPTPLASNAHVLAVDGLAVAPEARRRGAARALLDAAADEARRRGARRLTLRVLGPNTAARRLYAASGFVEEGVLREEFHLDGAYVDDHLLAWTL